MSEKEIREKCLFGNCKAQLVISGFLFVVVSYIALLYFPGDIAFVWVLFSCVWGCLGMEAMSRLTAQWSQEQEGNKICVEMK